VARLIYAFLALSLGTLVAGFLIRDSSVPLLVSIGLSAVVLLLILVGTSRRLRRANAFEDEQAELADLEIVEVDERTTAASDGEPTAVVPIPRPSRGRRTATLEPDTQAMDTVDELEALLASDEPDDSEFMAPPPPGARRKPAARSRRSRDRVEPVGTASEPDAEETAVASPEVESVADAEPPLTIELPPKRRPARERRAAARSSAPTVGAPDRSVQPASLSPKVWVIPGRSRYHTPDCRFAKGETLREVTQATAERRGYVACNVCKPGCSARCVSVSGGTHRSRGSRRGRGRGSRPGGRPRAAARALRTRRFRSSRPFRRAPGLERRSMSRAARSP
jgi:hypothetical protein